MKKVTLLTMLLLFVGFSMMAQNSTQGKEFWFSYMENGYKYNNNAGWVENTVMVSAKRACTGTIAKPDGSLPPITFSVEDDGITYDCEKGQFSVIPIMWEEQTRSLTLGKRSGVFDGMKPQRNFVIKVIDGKNIVTKDVRYDGAAVTVKL